MADLTPAERLQPCLLDRLTDEHPDEVKESRDQRIVSLRRYRAGVLRDLDWLLNTGLYGAAEDLAEFDFVRKSVLNYGITDLCGMTASGLNPLEFERRLLDAIRTFEPRILPDTLSIRVQAVAGQMDHNAMSFVISGDLWALPTPDPLFVRTELDLDTGQCELKDRPNG
jgi:type VI secretion system protein ImpF